MVSKGGGKTPTHKILYAETYNRSTNLVEVPMEKLAVCLGSDKGSKGLTY